VVQALPQLKSRIPGNQIIHQTGEAELEPVRGAYQQAGVSSEVLAFMQDMPARFAQADLLICRSGASTVAEVAAAGKPAIFVPFPQAADDHQRRNAEAFVSRGAAAMIPQSELTPQRLADEVAALLNHPERLLAMGANARALAREHALDEIVEMIAAAAQAVRE
jgi:UDP-N-acetylglucosamine--N-acetylmuramyl-(pentapeptide) pyrophosphoryl-undecaprenol N-acetylglucosamine transferase